MHAPRWLTRFCQVLLIFVAVMGALAWLTGTQIHNWYEARQMAKSAPYLTLVPQPLPDITPSPVPGTTLTAFGYEFQVPWPSPVKSHIGDSYAWYLFRDGHGFVFWNSDRMNSHETLSSPAIGRFFAVMNSYPVLKKELYVTPDQISLFLWKRESARRILLLNLKSIIPHTHRISAFYTFERQGLRGFQIGDPIRDDMIELICFDSGDHRLDIYFSRKHNPTLTQPEINRVIQTLHVVTSPTEGGDPR